MNPESSANKPKKTGTGIVCRRASFRGAGPAHHVCCRIARRHGRMEAERSDAVPLKDMSETTRPYDFSQQRLRQAIRRSAVIFAVTALIATSGFFTVSAYQAEQYHVRSDAARAADLISLRVAADPQGWREDRLWLDSAVNNLQGPEEETWHEIVDRSGHVVSGSGEVPGFLSVVGEAPIMADNHEVATVRVGQVPHRVYAFAVVGLGLGLLLSVCVVIVLWVLPMRALNVACAQAETYRRVLEVRVRELEFTQSMLQRHRDELSHVAERLRDSREKEHKANLAKSEFLANMSHELRTPLNSILGFAEIMELGTFGAIGNERYREYLGHIHASGKHLLELINDMLDLAKVESGRLELEEDAVDFRHLLHDCEVLLQQRLDRGGLKFHRRVPERLPSLMADERKLKQILLNLLSNAIKYTPPNGRVSVRAWRDRKGRFNFSVADTGIGMAPEDIPKALEPFGQVDNVMISSEEGTGLGLPLTKALVELHGGTFGLESEVGKGTIATVTIPAERILSPRNALVKDGAV